MRSNPYSVCRARAIKATLMPTRASSDLNEQQQATTTESRSRRNSTLWPPPSDAGDQNSGGPELDARQYQNTLHVPGASTGQLPALSPPGTPISPVSSPRQSRIYNITGVNSSATHSPSLSRRLFIEPSGSTRSLYVPPAPSSNVTSREISVCLGLLVFSAMHVS